MKIYKKSNNMHAQILQYLFPKEENTIEYIFSKKNI
jgi:hypothetical protein